MNPNVTEVDIYSGRELQQAPMGSVTPSWLGYICDPGPGANAGQTYKLTYEQIANIISGVIGSGIVEPDRFYVGGQPGPVDPETGLPVTVPVGGTTVNDTYLNDKPFSLELRGIGFLRNGVEWDNNVPGGGWRLLSDVIYADAVYTVHFHPKISNIIATPDAIGKFISGVQEINSDTLITSDMFRKLLVLKGGYKVTLAADYPENIVCGFTVNSPSNKQSTISAPAGQSIAFNGGTMPAIWLGKNESVELVRSGNTWYVLPGSTMAVGFDKSTDIIPGRVVKANQILAVGQLILRADYPRVVYWVNQMNIQFPGSVLPPDLWEESRTSWGFGDGITTIQVPDVRAQFPRWLDLGAGIDQDRMAAGLQNKPGSPQGMDLQEHNHINGNYNRLLINDGFGTATGADNDPSKTQPNITSSAEIKAFGGKETRPMNEGELPLVYL